MNEDEFVDGKTENEKEYLEFDIEQMDCPSDDVQVTLPVDIPPTSDVCYSTASSIQSLINSSNIAGSRQTLQNVIEAITQRRKNLRSEIELREVCDTDCSDGQLSLVSPAVVEGKPLKMFTKKKQFLKGQKKPTKKSKSTSNITRNLSGNYPLPEKDMSLVYPDMFYPYPGVTPVLVAKEKFFITSESPSSQVPNQIVNTYSEQPSYLYTSSPSPVFNIERLDNVIPPNVNVLERPNISVRQDVTKLSSLQDHFPIDMNERAILPESDLALDSSLKADSRTIEALSNKIRKRQQSKNERENGEEISKRLCLRALSTDEGIGMKSPDSGYNETCSSPTDSVSYFLPVKL